MLAPDHEALREHALRIAGNVPDPELPVLTISELGILRGVAIVDGHVEVTITPTYSGCPAIHTVARDIATALAACGIADVRIRTVLAPAWSSDWLTEDARRKLRQAGIAPPDRGPGNNALFGEAAVPCPRCGSQATERIAPFGSTACKALWRCTSCGEPFDHFKCH